MFRYIVRRLVLMVPMVLFITAFVFLLGQYGAPDLALERTLRLNNNVFDQEIYENLKLNMGLDGSPVERFVRFVGNAVQGDFGVSYSLPGNPDVGRLILGALPISLQLGLAALVIALAVGIPAGVLAAVYRNRPLDYAIVTVSTVLSSIPPFVLGPVALVLLVSTFQVLPSTGFGWHGLFSTETLLPASVLAAGPLLVVLRFTRSSVIDVLSQDYIRAARAKGLSTAALVRRHVVRNAMTPVLSALGVVAGFLLSGTIFIETVFGIRGFGHVTVTAFQSGDVNTVAAATLVSGLIAAIVNLLTDLLYGVLDPRVKVSA